MTYFNSNYDETYPATDFAPQFGLSANTELTYTLPGDRSVRYRIEFKWPYNANVFVAYNVTATLPTADVMDGDSRSELRPDRRYASGGDVLHFISRDAVTDAGMSILQLPNPKR